MTLICANCSFKNCTEFYFTDRRTVLTFTCNIWDAVDWILMFCIKKLAHISFLLRSVPSGFTLVMSVLLSPQITSGYFTWTDGPPALSNVDIKIPFGEHPICFSVWFPSVIYQFACFDLAPLSLSLSNQTSQVNWRWLWARWVVGNRLCCWQLWERCSVCQEQSPGTGQSQVPSFLSLTAGLFEIEFPFICHNSSCVRLRQTMQFSVLHQKFLCAGRALSSFSSLNPF